MTVVCPDAEAASATSSNGGVALLAQRARRWLSQVGVGLEQHVMPGEQLGDQIRVVVVRYGIADGDDDGCQPPRPGRGRRHGGSPSVDGAPDKRGELRPSRSGRRSPRQLRMDRSAPP